MKKPGRPKLLEQKKTNRVGVFFTAEEYAKIQLNAERAKLTEAEFLRQLGLGKEVTAPPHTINFVAVKEINAIGKNLNSLTRFILSEKMRDAADILISVRRIEVSLKEVIIKLLERS